MFFPEGQIQVYLYGQPADMRCSFNGLQALTRQGLGSGSTERRAVCLREPSRHADARFIF